MKILLIWSFTLITVNLLVIREDKERDGQRRLAAGTRKNHDEKVNNKGVFITLPTVKCAEINSNENDSVSQDKACQEHCRLLKDEFTEGGCVAGFCLCRLDISDVIQSALCKVNSSGDPTDVNERPRNEAGVKCENLIRLGAQIGEENHKGCGVHCRLLNSKNKDGHCIKGVCHCFKTQITKNIAGESGNTRSKVYKKKDMKTVKYEDSTQGSNQKRRSQCRNLKSYNDIEDNCQWESNLADPVNLHEQQKENDRKPKDPDVYLTPRLPEKPPFGSFNVALNVGAFQMRNVKKCEHRRRSANEGICKEHCEAFSKDHTQGRCVDGICRCGYAVFENDVIEL